MKKQILLLSLILLVFCAGLASATIENVPVNVTYDNSSKTLLVTGENLYWTKIIDNNGFSQIVNVIKTSGDTNIINLQIALNNMTSMCNGSMSYIDKYVACELRNRALEDAFNQINDTRGLLDNCTADLKKCNDDLTWWTKNGITSADCDKKTQDAKNQSDGKLGWLIPLCIVGGALIYYGVERARRGAKKPDSLKSWPTGS